MVFADDLLEQAYHLANREDNPSQASLRRAVSTAYYALFHLLIDEAVTKWAVERQRGAIGRTFEHKAMKSVCEDYVKNFYSAGKPESDVKLKNVAQTFAILQERRHTADYDVSFNWSRTNAIGQIDLASAAFEDWRAIRTQDAAQDYLLNLFLPRAAERMKSSKGDLTTP
jgi:uncharacterized protein (UPF0332 family)